MGLLEFVIAVAVLGLVWYLVTTFVPMPAPGKTILSVVFVVILLILVLQLFGLTGYRLRG
jgi:hypothetical protein